MTAAVAARGSAVAPENGEEFAVAATSLSAVADAAKPHGGSSAADKPTTASGFEGHGLELDSTQPVSTLEFSTVRVYSGLLTDEHPVETATPVALRVPELGIDASVRDVGYDPVRNVMEVPGDAETVGWYRFGAVPGDRGSAVLAAHVSWYGERGMFFSLGELAPGARIEVEFSDGTAATFEAIARESYAKSVLPTEQLFAKDVPAVLHLITCGGDFDASAGNYRDNVVVSAVLVDAEAERRAPAKQ